MMRRYWTDQTIGGRFMPHIGTIGFLYLFESRDM